MFDFVTESHIVKAYSAVEELWTLNNYICQRQLCIVCESADDSISVCSGVIILVICVYLFQQHLHIV